MPDIQISKCDFEIYSNRITYFTYVRFRYDQVFGMETSQETIFEKVGVPMIDE